jgi:methionyl aminopeptidase
LLPTPARRRADKQVDDEGRRLIRATHDALMAAIAACRPGAKFRDLGDVISRHVGNAG